MTPSTLAADLAAIKTIEQAGFARRNPPTSAGHGALILRATPPGVAQALADQWGGYVEGKG